MAIRGKSLIRVFELRETLQRFLPKKKPPLAAHFCDKVQVTKQAYLCDIFSQLNELNLSLQGKTTTVFNLADKVAVVKAKRHLWGHADNKQLQMSAPPDKISKLLHIKQSCISDINVGTTLNMLKFNNSCLSPQEEVSISIKSAYFNHW